MKIDLNKQGLEGVFDIEKYCIDNNIDAKKVTGLDCSDNELTELKGLNKLVYLECLYCEYNQLSELDVSNLVNLEYLYCEYNQLSEIKGLDKLVNLNTLYCYDNNLTELDVSNLVNLKWLRCIDNKITELDVSKLVNLEELNGKKYIQPEPETVILDNKR